MNGNFNGDFDVGNSLWSDFEDSYGSAIDASSKCKACNPAESVCGGEEGTYTHA